MGGFEPPSGDSIDNMTLASWWSTPLYYQSISLSTPPRQEGTFANFVTLQYNTLLSAEASHNLSVEPPVGVMNEYHRECRFSLTRFSGLCGIFFDG